MLLNMFFVVGGNNYSESFIWRRKFGYTRHKCVCF